VKLLRHLLSISHVGSASRFDRYYGEVVRPGVGYPTADEARRDLVRNDRSVAPFGWLR